MRAYDEKRRFFDRAAHLWEEGRFDEKQRRTAQWIIRQAGITPGMTVLEPGCGAGRMTRLLADAVGPQGKVIAADISGRMVAAARRNISASQVEIHHAAAEDLQLPVGSIDVVLCFDVFPHFEHPATLLDRFRAALKPGGRLIVAHCPGRKAVNQLHESAGGAVGADRLPPAGQMRALLRSGGFRVQRLLDRADVYFLQASPACE